MRRQSWLIVASSLVVSTACGGDGKGGDIQADGSDQTADGGDSACKPCTDCEESIPVTSAYHVADDIQYPDPPPTSGDHHPCWVPFGVYEQEVPDERWVHNLEHGGVVLLYECDDCDAEIAAMADMVRGRPMSILSPYAGLPSRFAMVSWGHRLLTDCFNEAQFARFYEDHVDRAPESVSGAPSAAECAWP
jgi:hypothetical protein